MLSSSFFSSFVPPQLISLLFTLQFFFYLTLFPPKTPIRQVFNMWQELPWKSQTPTHQQPGESKSGQAREMMKVSDSECLWGSCRDLDAFGLKKRWKRKHRVYTQVKGCCERKKNLLICQTSRTEAATYITTKKMDVNISSKGKKYWENHIQSKSLVRSCLMNSF